MLQNIAGPSLVYRNIPRSSSTTNKFGQSVTPGHSLIATKSRSSPSIASWSRACPSQQSKQPCGAPRMHPFFKTHKSRRSERHKRLALCQKRQCDVSLKMWKNIRLFIFKIGVRTVGWWHDRVAGTLTVCQNLQRSGK